MDTLMINMKSDNKSGICANYSIISVNCKGRKGCFGFWIGENEGTHQWLSIFEVEKAVSLRCPCLERQLYLRSDVIRKSF